MKPDEGLQPTAKKIEKKIADEKPVELNQPFPEELGPEAVAASQAAQSAKKPEQKKEKSDSSSDDSKDGSGKVIAGYAAASLLQAPIKPPEPAEKDDKKATSDQKVKFLVALGVLLFALGILLTLVFTAVLGFIVMLLGAIGVGVGVLLPVHKFGK